MHPDIAPDPESSARGTGGRVARRSDAPSLSGANDERVRSNLLPWRSSRELSSPLSSASRKELA